MKHILRIEVDIPDEDLTAEQAKQCLAHVIYQGKDAVKELLCEDYANGLPFKDINNRAMKCNMRIVQ